VNLKNNASDFRRMAAECLAVARRMSLRSDREHMEAMAQRWTELAEESEKTNTIFSVPDPTQQPQPHQPQQAKLEPED
jgi:hypothetical protein